MGEQGERSETSEAAIILHIFTWRFSVASLPRYSLTLGTLSQVRKLGLEKEGLDTSKIDVEGIALEMEAFCVDMPDEALLLRQCSSVYCICRRPYDGFMLGCDGCQEWYHGPCLGITERQAENINSFLCVRCSATKTFKDAAQEGLNCCDRWLDKKVREEWRKKKHKKHYDRWKKARDEVINGKKALATAQADLQKVRN